MTGEVVEGLTGHIAKTKVLEVFDELVPLNHIAVGALLVILVQHIL